LDVIREIYQRDFTYSNLIVEWSGFESRIPWETADLMGDDEAMMLILSKRNPIRLNTAGRMSYDRETRSTRLELAQTELNRAADLFKDLATIMVQHQGINSTMRLRHNSATILGAKGSNEQTYLQRGLSLIALADWIADPRLQLDRVESVVGDTLVVAVSRQDLGKGLHYEVETYLSQKSGYRPVRRTERNSDSPLLMAEYIIEYSHASGGGLSPHRLSYSLYLPGRQYVYARSLSGNAPSPLKKPVGELAAPVSNLWRPTFSSDRAEIVDPELLENRATFAKKAPGGSPTGS
jgi:hypothetical protein